MTHSPASTAALEVARQLDALAARLTADAEALRRTAAETPSTPTAAGPESFLDIGQLAELLGLSRSAIYGLRYQGDGPPFIRIGSRVRYRPSDVDAWLAEQTDTSHH